SAVTFGGGVTADLARKILLGNLNVSGRFFIDLDELISDPGLPKTEEKRNEASLLTTEEIQDYIRSQNFNSPTNGEEISEELLFAIVDDAHMAPSGGNNQPWRFHYQDKTLHLFLEEAVALAYLDPNYISSYISLGSAIENLILSAARHHLKVNWELTPNLMPKHIAWFSFTTNYEPTALEKNLATCITNRHTNRKIAAREAVEPTTLTTLINITSGVPGANLKWITDIESIKSLAGISAHTDLLRMFIPEAHADFIQREMRWDLNQVNETQDGIGIHTLDLSNNDQIGLRLIKDKRALDFLQKINGGNGFKRLAMQQFMASSTIGLITMPKGDETAFINGGRALERLWLAATGMELQIHPVNVPLIFFHKNSVEKNLAIPEQQKTVLTQLEQNFNTIFKNN
ncbi:MAG: nitroreductase family protein, partial [Bacteroidia bacterium]